MPKKKRGKAKGQLRKSRQKTPTNKKSIYVGTTIFALIGTLIYSLLVWAFYPVAISLTNILIFFILVWVVYYILVRSRARKY